MQAPRTRCRFLAATAGLPLALLLFVLAPHAGAASIDEVPSGTMLSKDNWQIAQGYLPDEIQATLEQAFPGTLAAGLGWA